MSERLAELALKKQRLLLRSADLRDRMGAHAQGLAPVFVAVDWLREAGTAARRHPEWVAAGIVAVVVVRPRFAWRWVRRGYLGWRMWTSARKLLAPP